LAEHRHPNDPLETRRKLVEQVLTLSESERRELLDLVDQALRRLG